MKYLADLYQEGGIPKGVPRRPWPDPLWLSARLLTATILGAILSLTLPTGEAVAAARPNFILITLDDAGVQLGSYGDHTQETPNLDRIANEGVRFSNGYVSQSSCSSSRSTMFTGLYPHQNGQIGLAHLGFSMSRAFPTIPSILRNAGYRTGVIGKVHVSPASAFSWTFQPPYRQWTWGTRDVRRIAAEARTFFDGDAPFFLKVSYLDPHEPRPSQVLGIPPADQLLTATDITTNTWTGQAVAAANKPTVATYYNSLKRIDIGVGMLLAALDAAGKSENTLIIVVGDNGGGPVQGGKTDIREGGLKIPFLVRFPAQGQSRQVRNELVSTVDILPTILDAAQVAVPEPTRSLMTEGRSLLPLVRGAAVPQWRSYLFAEMEYHSPQILKPARSVRDERYKLVRTYPPLERGADGLQLFDLRTDPMERNDLAGLELNRATRARLLAQLDAWQARTNDFRR